MLEGIMCGCKELLSVRLRSLGACEKALEWITLRNDTFMHLWDICDRPEWLVWLLVRLGYADEIAGLMSSYIGGTQHELSYYLYEIHTYLGLKEAAQEACIFVDVLNHIECESLLRDIKISFSSQDVLNRLNTIRV